MSACILIPSLLSQFGPLAGYTHRLGQFMDGMDQLKAVEEAVSSTGHDIQNSGVVAMQNMTCMTPDGKPLFKDLTYTVKPDESIVIMGASGVGKRCVSSQLRLVATHPPPDIGVSLQLSASYHWRLVAVRCWQCAPTAGCWSRRLLVPAPAHVHHGRDSASASCVSAGRGAGDTRGCPHQGVPCPRSGGTCKLYRPSHVPFSENPGRRPAYVPV